MNIIFASGNESKASEVIAILGELGIDAYFAKLALKEIQSDSLEEIAKEKSEHAYSLISAPVIVEDDGLFIDSLRGFPGQYSSFVYKTIGNDGITKLMHGISDRSARFRAVISYRDSWRQTIYIGETKGSIAPKSSGDGWGYDPIFLPEGSDMTFAEMKEEKNKYSHRRKALEKFAQDISKSLKT